MNQSFFTNLMLVIIAGLLLVLVIQNGMDASGPSIRSSVTTNPHSAAPQASRPTSPPAGATMGAEMFFAALRGFPEGCDQSQLLSACDSAQAQQVKQQIAAYARGKGPRQVFDYIIETWGESALSEQALRIRRQVRGQ